MLKRIVTLLLIFSMLLLTSCHKEESADLILRNFCGSYGLVAGRVYSTEEREGTEGYLEPQLLTTLYGTDTRPFFQSAAVMLYADMDTLLECGVFVCRGGAGRLYDILETEKLLSYRIRQIRLIFPEAQGQILRYGNSVVYTVLPDNARAERLFSRLL